MRRTLAILSLIALLSFAGPATALAQTPKTSLYEIESQVMCVVCRTPLAVANGPQADAERALIKRLIAQGKTTDQIKDAMVAEYGDRVLALPDNKGFNLAVYLIPVLVVVAALALAAFALPRWRRHARAVAAAGPGPLGPELSSEDAARLDQDLRTYD